MRAYAASLRRFLIVVLVGAGCCKAQVGASGSTALVEEDGRLNAAYKERVGQLSGDPAVLAELRKSEREWIRQRDTKCGKAVGCLTSETRARADALTKQVLADTRGVKPGATVAAIPVELWGKWVVRKVLPTETISCWDDRRARALVGTEIEYAGDGFRWKNKRVRNLGATSANVTAKEFAEDNSGGGAVDSQVSFRQLGITTGTVKQISIRHPDVVMGEGDGAGEMPGETVLMTRPGTMIFSVCNVYFEARRPELGDD